MAPQQSPVVRLRRLARVLEDLRAKDGRTAGEVAGALGWAATTITRMENGKMKLPQVRQVEKLLAVYGVAGDEREAVLDLVRAARERGWWHPHSGSLREGYLTYIGLEFEADIIRNYQSQLVPGLLQTEEYARAVITGLRPDMTQDQVEQRVEVRMRRQRLRLPAEAHHPAGPEPYGEPLSRLWAVIDEAVLRRQVGSPQVMRDQLQHLLTMADLSNVTLQVIPYSVGAHPGTGPFVHLTFGDLDPELVYADTITGELMVEAEQTVALYRLLWIYLTSTALSTEQSIDMIRGIVKTLPDPEVT
ncbi:MAG: transcriptional regulator [Gemmatimonadales bacterium]|nr:transcriptional regulator [Gemmatimonadales bacterium]